MPRASGAPAAAARVRKSAASHDTRATVGRVSAALHLPPRSQAKSDIHKPPAPMAATDAQVCVCVCVCVFVIAGRTQRRIVWLDAHEAWRPKQGRRAEGAVPHASLLTVCVRRAGDGGGHKRSIARLSNRERCVCV